MEEEFLEEKKNSFISYMKRKVNVCLETSLEVQNQFTMHFHRDVAEAGKHGFYLNVIFHCAFTSSNVIPNTV